jgi:hypothetical protein
LNPQKKQLFLICNRKKIGQIRQLAPFFSKPAGLHLLHKKTGEPPKRLPLANCPHFPARKCHPGRRLAGKRHPIVTKGKLSDRRQPAMLSALISEP